MPAYPAHSRRISTAISAFVKGLCHITYLTFFFLTMPLLAFGETVAWTQDALLHDGRIVKVSLRAANSIDVSSPWPFVLDFRRSNLDRYRVEANHPDTKQHIIWEGERHFIPVIVDFVRGIPYLVVYGRPDKRTAEIYGCPELPYIYLQHTTGTGWIPVPVEQAPIQLQNANLSASNVSLGLGGRHLSLEAVTRDIQDSERTSAGNLQAAIPRTYDEWRTTYKNSARNERKFGDCRPLPKPPPDTPLPKPIDIELEAVETSDHVTTADEGLRLFYNSGTITRARCSGLFKVADRDNLMLGDLFVNDPTGKKRLPYVGPIPFPSGRMLEMRAARYCDDKFIWFVAEHEERPELRKTRITKYTIAGDFVYSVRMTIRRPQITTWKGTWSWIRLALRMLTYSSTGANPFHRMQEGQEMSSGID